MVDLVEPWKSILAPWESLKSVKPGTLIDALIYIEVAALVSGIISAIVAMVFPANPLIGELGGGLVAGFSIAGIIVSLIVAPIFFLIWSGIIFLIAKLLSGNGSFEKQSFYMAFITYPLSIIASVSGIPLIGGVISLIAGIWALISTIFAVKYAHDFSTGKAAAAVIVPILVLIVLAAALAIATIGSLASLMKYSM